MRLDNFTKNLRYLRRKHGYSQPFIASLCNKKSYTTVQKWECGDAEPSLKDVQTLAELYSIDIDVFVREDLENLDASFRVGSPKDVLEKQEIDLITAFRKLNEDGKEYVYDQVEWALSKDKYVKKEKSAVGSF